MIVKFLISNVVFNMDFIGWYIGICIIIVFWNWEYFIVSVRNVCKYRYC